MDPHPQRNGWFASLIWAAAVMALVLAVAIPGNLAAGRVIHWDVVPVRAPAGLAGFSLTRRHGRV